MKEMEKPIILIGPMAAGKSSVAQELGVLTKIPRRPMDRLRWYYYFKNGFSLEAELEMENFTQVTEYWKPFELKAVTSIIEEFPDSIIDFGAGHSYYPDEAMLTTAENILSDFPNIFLLLPSDDKEESLQICNERLKNRKKEELSEEEKLANKNFVFHKSNETLAKHTIYSKGKTPLDVAEEIQSLLL